MGVGGLMLQNEGSVKERTGVTMRLTCPNCSAQYEVPGEVIPQDGRDVQCSDCGHTWFQTRAETTAPAEDSADQPPEPDAAAAAASEQLADPTSEGDAKEQLTADTWAEDYEDEPADVDTAPLPQPARRSLDPGVADVLRAEAERESRVRAAEGSLESQPELGLDSANHDDAASRRARLARERMARIQSKDSSAGAATAAAAGMAGSAAETADLPDIEKINSTLRASSEPRALETPQGGLKEGGSGFARGFVSMLLLMAVLIGIYVMAPTIKGWVPELSGIMDSYVSEVDKLRLWLSGVTQNMLTWLDGMSSETATQ